MAVVEEAFRRLTIGDPRAIASLGEPGSVVLGVRRLDGRTEALLRLAAMVALDAPASSYRTVVQEALRTGARTEELIAALAAVASTVGSARIVSAAPRIALATGYDAEEALESHGDAPPRAREAADPAAGTPT